MGVEINPAQVSGISLLLDKLTDVYALDDKEKAWTSLDKFFNLYQGNKDFQTYLVEFNRLFEEAERHGNLQMNNVSKNCLFFSRASLSGQRLTDLRRKVDGDLTRFEEMVALQSEVAMPPRTVVFEPWD